MLSLGLRYPAVLAIKKTHYLSPPLADCAVRNRARRVDGVRPWLRRCSLKFNQIAFFDMRCANRHVLVYHRPGPFWDVFSTGLARSQDSSSYRETRRPANSSSNSVFLPFAHHFSFSWESHDTKKAPRKSSSFRLIAASRTAISLQLAHRAGCWSHCTEYKEVYYIL